MKGTSCFYIRIAIWGPPASGKTILALKLGKILDIPVYHSDALFHNKLARHLSVNILKRRIIPLLKTPNWIIDGYFGELRREVAKRATKIVILNPPLRKLILRIAFRTYRSRTMESENWFLLTISLVKIAVIYKLRTFRSFVDIAYQHLDKSSATIVEEESLSAIFMRFKELNIL
ncbi:MAG: hypothetical protein ACFFB3_07710 [Candidatus Hodarchaeota archaeon]